jgi:hypothetical protein
MFRSARTSSRWLRASLVVLLLAFTLNVAAHAAHSHNDAKVAQAAHSAACGYCAAYGGFTDAPSNRGGFAPLNLATELSRQPSTSLTAWLIETAARPRAPPVS